MPMLPTSDGNEENKNNSIEHCGRAVYTMLAKNEPWETAVSLSDREVVKSHWLLRLLLVDRVPEGTKEGRQTVESEARGS